MGKILIIPSIDIQDGKTVRVVQGIPELGCIEYANDPCRNGNDLARRKCKVYSCS